MKVDQDLSDLSRDAPEEIVQVVLCCSASAKFDKADLARHGFEFEERQVLAGEVFVHGSIRAKDIKHLSSISGIEAVSGAPIAEIC